MFEMRRDPFNRYHVDREYFSVSRLYYMRNWRHQLGLFSSQSADVAVFMPLFRRTKYDVVCACVHSDEDKQR